MTDAFGKMRLRVGYNLQYNRWRKEGASGEVDFVCDRGGERLYVQVAYVLADERTREREFGAFEKIRSLDRKLLLTMDRIDMGEGTVKHMYIPDFMVSREPLE